MKIQTVGAFEAKTHFSQLLEQVHQGAVFVVTRRGKPIAQLQPAEQAACHPFFGSAKGQVQISEDFDEPLADMVEYMS